jgi:hypothetical protein
VSVESFGAVPVEHYGGLVTLVDPADLPIGLSPFNRDVEFVPGKVRSRPGLSLPFTAISGNPKVNGLKSFITLTLEQRLVVFTSDGRLFVEQTPGALTLAASGLVANGYLKAETQFGREYMAFSDNREGLDMPRAYDDTVLARVSQLGPGEGPVPADTANPGLIPIGVHGVIVWFETRSGYWTRPSPPVTWSAAGNLTVQLTNIPIGPANVVKRHVGFTTAGGARYFYVASKMAIDDNTTTTLEVNFSDEELASGENVDYLFRLEVLPYVMGVSTYASRMVWWGEENSMQDWRNLSFDGGFASTGRPLGWTAGAAFAGGGKESTVVAFGDAYKLTGDGATALRGEITQNALVDAWDGVALIEKNRAYTVRARVARTAGLAAGTLRIHLKGTAGVTIDTVGLEVSFADAETFYQEFEAELTPEQTALSTDLVLRLVAEGTPTNGESFFVDEVRIFPTDEPTRAAILRVSKALEPDSYDGTDGLISVRQQDGQAVRAVFNLREFYYVVKERSLHVTQDDERNEPAGWPVELVSEVVGTPSPHGADVGEGFAIIASRAGAYYFDGGVPQKVSQEIQPTWDAINWSAGHRLWVQVNHERKEVRIGVPTGAATEPNVILVCNYIEGWGDPLENPGRGRKWTVWHIPANSAGMIERATGNVREFFGNNASNGKVYELDPAATNDDGVAITARYRTAYLTRPDGDGQASSLRNLFGALTMYAIGAGSLDLTAYLPGQASTVTLPSLTLADPATKDLEVLTNIVAERVAYEFGTDGTADYWEMAKFVAYAKGDPWSPVRGQN